MRRSGIVKGIAVAGIAFVPQPLRAALQLCYWDGAESNGNWSDLGNWSGAGNRPDDHNDQAYFEAATTYQPVLNASYVIGQVYFWRGGTTISPSGGSVLSIDNYTNNGRAIFSGQNGISGSNTINATVSFVQAGQTMETASGNTLSMNSITGASGFEKTGPGTLVITGNLTAYSGATTVSAGTLRIGNGGAVGTPGSGDITNNATLAVNRSDTLTMANTIGGTGILVKQGAGALILTANNSVASTTISAGTLQVGNGGASGWIGGGTIANSGSLVFNRGDTFTVSNTITGGGTLAMSGSGTLVFIGYNGSGGVRINSGVLQIGNGSAWGSIGGGAIVNNAAFHFNIPAPTTLNIYAPISGSGSVTVLGPGHVSFQADNSYLGSTVIQAGQLQIGTGGTTGTLGAGPVTNNAALVFVRTDTFTVPNDIGGTGSLHKGGSGTMIVTGNNTYGTTLIDGGGTLQVGNGGTTGTLGTGTVTNKAVLAFNRGDAVTFANLITGSGSLAQVGSGTLQLPSSNSYTGSTEVAAGTLRVTNASGSATGSGPVFVRAAATLRGAGRIGGSVQVDDFGRVLPGDSAGTLSVHALALSDNSELIMDLFNPEVTGGGVNDLIDVGTDLVLDGRLSVLPGPSFGMGRYPLFTYGGDLENKVLRFGVMPPGFGYEIDIGRPGIVDLVVTPDPGALLGLSLVPLALVHRRRRQ